MRKNTVVFGIVAIVVIAFLFTIITKKAPSEYVPDETKPTETEEPTSPYFDSYNYIDEENSWSIKVIEGWQKVIDNNSLRFIDSKTASGVEIFVKEYNPIINNYTDKNIPVDQGAILTSFSKPSNCEYLYEYYTEDDGKKYNYVVYNKWDFKKIYTFKFTVPDEYSTYMQPKISYMIDSIYVMLTSQIPTGYSIHYDETAKFEFLVKDTWQANSTNTGYIMYDQKYEMNVTISVVESHSDFSNVNQNTYIDFISRGRTNFCLTYYSNNKSLINGEATYREGTTGITYCMFNYMIATGNYEISICFDFPKEKYDSDLNSIIISFTDTFTYY